MSSLDECRQILSSASKALEHGRCLEGETEATMLWNASLLEHQHPSSSAVSNSADASAAVGNNEVDVAGMPGSLQDAWMVYAECANRHSQKGSDWMTKLWQQRDDPNQQRMTIPVSSGGQWHQALFTTSLHAGLQHAQSMAQKILEERQDISRDSKTSALKVAHAQLGKSATNNSGNNHSHWLTILDEQVHQLQQYHAQNINNVQQSGSNKRMRLGHPASDGYDLAASVVQPNVLTKSKSSVSNSMEDDDGDVAVDANNDVFTSDQVWGKYLDFKAEYRNVLEAEVLRKLFMTTAVTTNTTSATKDKEQTTAKEELTYSDFMAAVARLPDLPEEGKMKDPAIYASLLERLETNLSHFLRHTAPLIDANVLVQIPLQKCQESWAEHGGYVDQGYVARESERVVPIDLSKYDTSQALLDQNGHQQLATELGRLGLKTGGSPLQRAERLLSIKGIENNRDAWPRKIMLQRNKKTGWSRYAVCQLEVRVQALIQQVRPTLETTLNKIARAATQTPREAQQELEQELYGVNKKSGGGNNPNDDDSDDDEPIYNPKNVPLDWDGKPIPYWLFKLHGLQHYFTCEICGGESYRGRHQFELHFGDQKHAYGLQSLGIPNTRHFHGVTSIRDAQALHASLQGKLQTDQWDASRDEEYEDSQGNVLSRQTYEDLGRQGLL